MITTVKECFAHAFDGSFWIYNLHLSCCGPEAISASGPKYDWERLGCKISNDHRNADVLLISGTFGPAMFDEVKRVYDEMRSPKYVIAMGACACTGGMFAVDEAGGFGGVDRVIPVDVFVPGCPPRPESVLNAILQLKKQIAAVT